MTSKMAFGAWSFGVMGASIFTFVWLVSIMHNVDRSWAFHSVDHSLIMSLDSQCVGGNVATMAHQQLTGSGPSTAENRLNFESSAGFAKYAGNHVVNASCVADAVDTWQQDVADLIDGSSFDRTKIVHDNTAPSGLRLADASDREDYFAYASLQDYENGANTSVITALVFTSVAMIVGVANFIMLLVSSKRYTMLESLFCFCAGFGSVIVIASPWISDVILTTAGAEFVALPVIVAFQITLLWVRPGATEDVESSDGFMF